jgi:protein translocase SecG subunit
MGLLLFLHFVLAAAIIFFVLVQRSAESTILVSSQHFAPGGANKLLVKITRTLVIIFFLNCFLISYLKYHKSKVEEAKVDVPVAEKSVPMD